jgi:chromosomal replication initiation ATPase DnaA
MSPAAALNSNAVVTALSIRGLLYLADSICARRGVTRDELCSYNRTAAVAAARHELWWMIRNHPERRYSFSEIGRIVHRDHASVRHGVTAHVRRAGRVRQHP